MARSKKKKLLKEYIGINNTLKEVGDEPQDQGGMDNLDTAGGGNPIGMGDDGGMPQDGGMGPDGGMPQDDGMGPDGGMEPDGEMGPEGGAEGQSAPEGFNPQGIDQNSGIDGMGGPEGGQPDEMGGGEFGTPEENEDEEVIDVDDLTQSQEKSEHILKKLTSKFDKLLSAIDAINDRVDKVDSNTNKFMSAIEDFKADMDKRNPTPQQRLTMRSLKSAPYNTTVNEYMNNYAPDNYSGEPDNNGADDPQYKITQGDIDKFTDYSSIEKDLDNKRSLRDIFGY